MHVFDVMASPEAVSRLWQELTGNALSRERAAEFVQCDEVGELAQFTERRLRRAAKQVPQVSWLLLSAWLSAARDVSVEPTHRGDHFDDSHKGRMFDPHPSRPADSGLHRRIGPTQRYGE
jgi:hypothetical protein